MNRTFVLWQEADISKVGGHRRHPGLTRNVTTVYLPVVDLILL